MVVKCVTQVSGWEVFFVCFSNMWSKSIIHWILLSVQSQCISFIQLVKETSFYVGGSLRTFLSKE